MKYLRAGVVLLLCVLLLVIACNVWVVRTSAPYMYARLDSLPARPAGLVLGTSRKFSGGAENLFFKYRMEAAARLYRTGKVKSLIISGDNSSRYYNEPSDMKKALMRLGVPEAALTLDYAGQNTLQSVVRCQRLYDQDSVIVVSQAFHGARAVFIARRYRLPFIAYAARDVPWRASAKTLLREYLARPKAILDVYVLEKDETVFEEDL